MATTLHTHDYIGRALPNDVEDVIVGDGQHVTGVDIALDPDD